MKPVVTVAAQGEIYIRRIYGDPATYGATVSVKF